MNINDLIIGKSYSNGELMDAFKCGRSGGLRKSNQTNTLVIIFDHNKMYDDAWKGDVLHYTGMGRIGNQDINYMQNKTLNESGSNGVDLHLFEVFEEGRYEYCGPVELAGEPYQEIQPDTNGDNRNVWMFPLRSK